MSLTVLTGPDIKSSIVKGQPNETIGDLLSLRLIRRLTLYNVSVRPWVSCAVELVISGLELMTSFRLLHFYFLSDF